jgi:hypothetical protein
MKKNTTIFGAIIFASVIFTSCGGGKSESDKITTDSTKVKIEKTESNSKDVIKAISEKYYIPVNESKTDFIFTINQNLNFELVNYKGSYEGKYIDGKIQFDDKNASIIDFSLKGENIILKNQNDVEVEFKQANDEDLLSYTWSYIYEYPSKNVACKIIIDNKGNWNCPRPLWSAKGKYKKLGDKKYSLPKYSDQETGTLIMHNAKSCSITWVDTFNEVTKKHNLSRIQKNKLESLNQIFN